MERMAEVVPNPTPKRSRKPTLLKAQTEAIRVDNGAAVHVKRLDKIIFDQKVLYTKPTHDPAEPSRNSQ